MTPNRPELSIRSTIDAGWPLERARQSRALYLRGLVSCVVGFGCSSPKLGGLLVVASISLLWLVLIGHDGGHGAVVTIAIVLAALVSGIAGIAFSAICGAMLFQFHDDPVAIVQIMITCSIANQAAITWVVRRDIDWRGLRIYFAGGVLGLPIGIGILMNLDRSSYTVLLGTFLLAYGSYLLVSKPLTIRGAPVAADFVVGLLSGVTGGAVGFPSTFIAIWSGMKGWDKGRQRAMVQPFILVMQIVALPVISMLHRSTSSAAGFDFIDLLFIPASLFGTFIGLEIYERLTDRQFGRAVHLLLIASGLGFIF